MRLCAIPLIKGPQRSKPQDEILREARELTSQGVREIILIAQNTSAYGRDQGERDALPGLLERLSAETPGLEWLRILYAYPQDVSERLIEAMARLSQVVHYVDLPLQHAHPSVLRRMRRPADVDRVRRLLGDLRGAMPDIALRMSFIVGFPGRRRRSSRRSWSSWRRCGSTGWGVSPTPRSGHRGGEMPDQVPARGGGQALQAGHGAPARDLPRAERGSRWGARCGCSSRGRRGLTVGRSYRDAPEIDGLVLIPGSAGRGFADVRITSAQEYDLSGRDR